VSDPGGESLDAPAAPEQRAEPVTSLYDPRALQILSTEHWSLLSARSLAYNEAFTRAGMFLTFLSMSFVALALVSQAVPVSGELLAIAALVLAFDIVVGLTTYGRIIAANYDDFRSLHGMARIRNGYGQIAPPVVPFFTTSRRDDIRGVMSTYGDYSRSFASSLLYGLTTSGGMIGLIVSMLAGVLALVGALLIGLNAAVGFIAAAIVGVALFLALVVATNRYFVRRQDALPALFPSSELDGQPPEPGA
jgi:hypothetical protein